MARKQSSAMLDFLAGGGEMGARMRAHDWTRSPLGAPGDWPQSLRTAVSIILNSRHPMFLAWGPKLCLLYNNGYIPLLGAKHPDVLGIPFKTAWRDIWADIDPLVRKAMAGEPTWSEDMHLVMQRNGYREDTWFTFSYSPVRDESGGIGGMFCAVTETTAKVLAGRRMKFQLDLESRLRDLADSQEILHAAAEALGRQLEVDQVSYAEVEPSGDWGVIDRDWRSGAIPSNAGRHRLADFGENYLKALRSGQTIAVDDPESDPRTNSPEALEKYRQVSVSGCLSIPLIKNGVLKAILVVAQKGPRRWQPEEILLAEEVAERTWAAVERARAEEALRTSEARFRHLADAMPQLVWTAGPDGEVDYYNARSLEYGGGPQNAFGYWDWAKLIHPDDLARTNKAWKEASETVGNYSCEHRIRRLDGTYAWHVSRAVPVRDSNGKALKWYGTATDIDELKRAEESRGLLSREVDHRAKNVLAVVQSIVKLTRAATRDEYIAVVNGRVGALARAHTLLSNQQWNGASLRRVLEDELGALAKPGQFALEGPDLMLTPDAVQPFGMIVHELATNATKYGALTAPAGAVDISWTEADGGLAIVWTEHGGPAPDAEAKPGFGSVLLGALSKQLLGEMVLDWPPTGLVATLTLPARAFRSSASEPAKAPPIMAAEPPKPRQGKVLVVEDNALIAMNLRDTLVAAGLQVIGPANSVKEALDLLAVETPVAAFLDVDLQGGTSLAVAQALERTNTPFAFCTGFEDPGLDAAYAGRITLRKPTAEDDLLHAFDRMTAPLAH